MSIPASVLSSRSDAEIAADRLVPRREPASRPSVAADAQVGRSGSTGVGSYGVARGSRPTDVVPGCTTTRTPSRTATDATGPTSSLLTARVVPATRSASTSAQRRPSVVTPRAGPCTGISDTCSPDRR